MAKAKGMQRAVGAVEPSPIGHQIKGRVERAYARSDLLDRRRIVMDRWAAHVTGVGADVVQLRG
jgi:hypothetical protein